MDAVHRQSLPQLGGDLFLTDGGLETFLIFERDLDLPEFAAFVLLANESGRTELRDYFTPFLDLAVERGLGFILESPTWRANPSWAEKIGYGPDELAAANRQAIELMVELREVAEAETPVVISGCVGPEDDGYAPGRTMTATEACAYHSTQVGTFAATDADMVTAITMSTPRRRSASPGRRRPPRCRPRSPSRSRPTAACLVASRLPRPSLRSMPTPTPRSPTS